MSSFEDVQKIAIVREILQHPCPACGHVRIFCEFPGCFADAEFDAWFGPDGGLNRRMHVCREHAKESRAYKAHGEKAFENTETEKRP